MWLNSCDRELRHTAHTEAKKGKKETNIHRIRSPYSLEASEEKKIKYFRVSVVSDTTHIIFKTERNELLIPVDRPWNNRS